MPPGALRAVAVHPCLPARAALLLSQQLKPRSRAVSQPSCTQHALAGSTSAVLQHLLEVDVQPLQSFGVGAAAVGTTLSAYALARLCMNIPSGLLADSRGRKPLLVWGPAITALGEPPGACAPGTS